MGGLKHQHMGGLYIIALLTLDNVDMQHVFMDIFWRFLEKLNISNPH